MWGIFILIFIFLLGYICYFFSNKVINIDILSDNRVIEMENESGLYNPDWYNDLIKEEFYIPSPFDYNLSTVYIPAKEPSQSTVVFSHGVQVSKIASIKYMKVFRDFGFNCLLYDQRRHGGSGGKYTSYGFYEKHDLKVVVDWVKERNGKEATIVIHGESMGASTLLQYGGMEDGADFYIADCPYASIWEQLVYRLKAQYKLPAFPLLNIVEWIIFLIAGFHLKDVNPIESIKKIDHPILFIHGGADDYIPPSASTRMYAIKKPRADIYLAPNARHAKSIVVDVAKYKQVVFEFLKDNAKPASNIH